MHITDPSKGSLLDNLLLELTTDLNGTQAPTTVATVYSITAGRGVLTAGPGTNYWSVVGAPSIQLDATRGRRLIELLISAARIVIHAGNGYGASLGMRFAGAGDPNYSLIRPPRRFTWAIPVHAPVRGVVPVECGLCISNGLLTTLGLDSGIFLVSDPAINGGRWTCRYRLTVGGAITTAADSGVALDTSFHVLGFRYTEGAQPTLEALVDGVTVTMLTGQAAIPAAALTNAYRLGLGMPVAAAGTTVRADDTVYRVETLD
jgi:hypothetical protein